MADRRWGGIITLWGPVVVYVLLIFYLSSITTVPTAPSLPHFDKLVHFLEYGLLGFLLGRALGLTYRRRRYWAVFAASLAVGACVGIADEYYQGTVAGRDRSAADFGADIVGLSVSLLILRAWAVRGRMGFQEPGGHGR